MTAKKVFWKEEQEIQQWKHVDRFKKKFSPATRDGGQRIPGVALRWIFRAGRLGQDIETALQEKLKLNGIQKHDWVTKERGIIRAFQRKAGLYLEREPDKDDILEWLAIMRHHGAPTRLLDWTYSFYIAVYFALNENSEGVVWALDCSRINRPEPIVKKICDQEDGFRKLSQALLCYMKKCDFLGLQQEGDKLIDLAIASHLIEHPLPFVYPVNPFRLNKRLSVQQGLFLMLGDITKSFVENLEATLDNTEGIEKRLCKIKIRPRTEDRNKILKQLEDMNISNEVLFPGLDGFARSVGEKLTYPSLPADRPSTK